MTRRPRRNHSPAFKTKVALAAIRVEKTLVELSQQFDVHAGAIDNLFARFDKHLSRSGYLAKGGQIVGATIIQAPK